MLVKAFAGRCCWPVSRKRGYLAGIVQGGNERAHLQSRGARPVAPTRADSPTWITCPLARHYGRLQLVRTRPGKCATGLRPIAGSARRGRNGRNTSKEATISRLFLLLALICSPISARAQTGGPPVIDVHMHAPMSDGPVEQFMPELQSTLALMDSLDVRFAVLTGVPDVLFAWRPVVEERMGVLSSLLFPCVNGLAVMWGRPCFGDGKDWPDVDRLRDDIEAGRVDALGEITTQFLGLGPSDPAFEPYFALAEEYDLPVFIHMGPGIPGTNTGGGVGDLPVPEYRAAAGNPLMLEEALIEHPGVRVAVMHAGWPLGDEMVFMLHQYPQVYAEVGLLQNTSLFTRTEYYTFLKRLVDAGFGDRILFGSDGSLAQGIDAILDAEFLTLRQKRDILCDNAARFLRLGEDVCR
jgi:hypothetical protein